MLGDGCSSCPATGGPLGRRGRPGPTASASGGRSPRWCAAGSLPHGASPPGARRTGTGCGCPSSSTRSPHTWAPLLGWHWFSDVGQQLCGAFVETDHRPLRVVEFGIQVQHILHSGHEVRAHLGDAQLCLLPRLERVFFRCSRTVSWDNDSTALNSTIRSASRRSFQWSWPSGAGLQARAI